MLLVRLYFSLTIIYFYSNVLYSSYYVGTFSISKIKSIRLIINNYHVAVFCKLTEKMKLPNSVSTSSAIG